MHMLVESDLTDAERALLESSDEAAPTFEDLRDWTELRKLQLDTERAELDLAAARRREREYAAAADQANVYTFYADVDSENVRDCMAALGQWSRRDPGSHMTVIFN